VNADLPLVLIVDDNDRNRKLARDVLRMAGLRTLEAADCGGGDRDRSEHLPDVILMDLRLPDLDGTGAARLLRAEPRTARIPVVAMTAWHWMPATTGCSRQALPLHRQANRRRSVSRGGTTVLRARSGMTGGGASIPRHMQAGTVGAGSMSS